MWPHLPLIWFWWCILNLAQSQPEEKSMNARSSMIWMIFWHSLYLMGGVWRNHISICLQPHPYNGGMLYSLPSMGQWWSLLCFHCGFTPFIISHCLTGRQPPPQPAVANKATKQKFWPIEQHTILSARIKCKIFTYYVHVKIGQDEIG